MKSLLIASAAVFLAACGAAPTPAVTVTAPTTVTATAPAPAPQPVAPTSDGELMRNLLSTQGFDYSGPASDLSDLGNSICEALDQGINPTMLVQVAIDNGFSMEEGAALVAASIVVICPWNESAV